MLGTKSKVPPASGACSKIDTTKSLRSKCQPCVSRSYMTVDVHPMTGSASWKSAGSFSICAMRCVRISLRYSVRSSPDVLSKAGLLRTLYRNEILTQRIAQMLNEPALFQLADPVMGCTSTVMYERDTHGWHFDLNDFVVSILLQAPEAGGTFDFVPNIRQDGDENYAAVTAAIDGPSP